MSIVRLSYLWSLVCSGNFWWSFAEMIHKFVVPLFALVAGTLAWPQSPARELARLLKEKGVITQDDLSRVEQLDAQQSVRLLTSILQEKGLIDGTEAARVQSGVQAVPADTWSVVQNQSVASVVQPPQRQTKAPAEGSVTAQSKFRQRTDARLDLCAQSRPPTLDTSRPRQ